MKCQDRTFGWGSIEGEVGFPCLSSLDLNGTAGPLRTQNNTLCISPISSPHRHSTPKREECSHMIWLPTATSEDDPAHFIDLTFQFASPSPQQGQYCHSSLIRQPTMQAKELLSQPTINLNDPFSRKVRPLREREKTLLLYVGTEIVDLITVCPMTSKPGISFVCASSTRRI